MRTGSDFSGARGGNRMDVMDAIRARRSARLFLDKPLPDGAAETLLEAARLAPSGGNGQNHLFGVVTEPNLKRELARAAGEQMWIAGAPVVLACCARVPEDRFDVPPDDFGRIVDELRFGRAFMDYIAACPDGRAVAMLFENAAPLIPMENMLLAAAGMGLSGCAVGYLDILRAGEILNLPEDIACLYLLPIGYAAQEPGTKETKPLDAVSFFGRYA
jgi:nitroreductase